MRQTQTTKNHIYFINERVTKDTVSTGTVHERWIDEMSAKMTIKLIKRLFLCTNYAAPSVTVHDVIICNKPNIIYFH